MRLAAVVLLVTALLAGCGGGKGSGGPDPDAGLDDLDARATDTTGIIRGIVVDAAIVPLGNVTLSIKAQNLTTTSTTLGAFAFEGLVPGTYFVDAARDGYQGVQSSVEVVAGDDDPKPMRIVLQAIPRDAPYVETIQHTFFMDTSTAVGGASLTLGGFTGQGSFTFGVDVAPNATVVQAELRWEPSFATGSTLELEVGTYDEGEQVAYDAWTGAEPLVGRVNATDGNLSADRAVFDVTADREPPVNIFINQAIDGYIHVFYNFTPRADWQFGRDGEYPVPT